MARPRTVIKTCGIYKITNKVNGKIYIGQSVNIHLRICDHKSALQRGKHYNEYLQRAWNKYGEESFEFETLLSCKETELDYYEKFYIKKFNSCDYHYGYNSEDGGNLNKKATEEKRKKQSESQNYRKLAILQIDLEGNIIDEWDSISMIRKCSIYNDRDIKECLRKRRKTHCNFIWIYKKEYNKSEFDLINYITYDRFTKPVIQKDLDNNIINKYESAREAERQTGISYKFISRCCSGKRKTTCGYIFEFAN